MSVLKEEAPFPPPWNQAWRPGQKGSSCPALARPLLLSQPLAVCQRVSPDLRGDVGQDPSVRLVPCWRGKASALLISLLSVSLPLAIFEMGESSEALGG